MNHPPRKGIWRIWMRVAQRKAAKERGTCSRQAAEIAALRNQVACLNEALEEAQWFRSEAQAQAREYLAALKETKATHDTAKASALDLLAEAYRKVAES